MQTACYVLFGIVLGGLCQIQISRAWTSNHIPKIYRGQRHMIISRISVGCYYFSMPLTLASVGCNNSSLPLISASSTTPLISPFVGLMNWLWVLCLHVCQLRNPEKSQNLIYSGVNIIRQCINTVGLHNCNVLSSSINEIKEYKFYVMW